MRRIFSFLVALGLAGLGPLPVSACALVYSQPSECATPQTKTQCERMGMEQVKEPSVKVSAGNNSCCIVSQAPAPELQNWAGNFSVATAPAIVSGIIAAMQPSGSAGPHVVRRDLSPPALQSLLCTFLI